MISQRRFKAIDDYPSKFDWPGIKGLNTLRGQFVRVRQVRTFAEKCVQKSWLLKKNYWSLSCQWEVPKKLTRHWGAFTRTRCIVWSARLFFDWQVDWETNESSARCVSLLVSWRLDFAPARSRKTTSQKYRGQESFICISWLAAFIANRAYFRHTIEHIWELSVARMKISSLNNSSRSIVKRGDNVYWLTRANCRRAEKYEGNTGRWKDQCPFSSAQHTEQFWNISSKRFELECSSAMVVTTTECSSSVVATTTEEEHSSSKRLEEMFQNFSACCAKANWHWPFYLRSSVDRACSRLRGCAELLLIERFHQKICFVHLVFPSWLVVVLLLQFVVFVTWVVDRLSRVSLLHNVNWLWCILLFSTSASDACYLLGGSGDCSRRAACGWFYRSSSSWW